jgi:hypothetical protein
MVSFTTGLGRERIDFPFTKSMHFSGLLQASRQS